MEGKQAELFSACEWDILMRSLQFNYRCWHQWTRLKLKKKCLWQNGTGDLHIVRDLFEIMAFSMKINYSWKNKDENKNTFCLIILGQLYLQLFWLISSPLAKYELNIKSQGRSFKTFVFWQSASGDLMIRNIQLKHSGKYVCMVKTEVDSVASAADLIVRGKFRLRLL